MTKLNSKLLVKAIAELVADGWTKTATVMSDKPNRLAYGVCFIKDGVKFYLNKDTYLEGWTAPAMAKACKPLFNY